MKKKMLILILSVSLTVVGFAFETGTKSVGGNISMRSDHYGGGPTTTSLSISPNLSYFVIDNLALEVRPGFGMSWSKDRDTGYGYSIGLGGRYFVKKFYGGVGFSFSFTSPKESRRTSRDLVLSLGRLFGIAKNIYLDFGINYNTGRTKSTFTVDIPELSGTFTAKNTHSSLNAGLGVSIFFK